MSFSFRKTSTSLSGASTQKISQDGSQVVRSMTTDDLTVLESGNFEKSLTSGTIESKVYNLEKVDEVEVGEDKIALYGSSVDDKLHMVQNGVDTPVGVLFDQNLNKTDDVVFGETTMNGDVSILGVPGSKTQAVIGAQEVRATNGEASTIGWSFIPSVDINVRVFKIATAQWVSDTTVKDMAIFRYSDDEIIGSKVSMTKENIVDGYYTKAVDNFTLYAGIKYLIAAYAEGDDRVPVDDVTYEHAEQIGSVELYYKVTNTSVFGIPDLQLATNSSHFPNFDFGEPTVTRNLIVEGTGTFDGALDVYGAAKFDDTVTVEGKTTLRGQVDIAGGTIFRGVLKVNDITYLYDKLDAYKHVNFRSTLNVFGDTSLHPSSVLNVGGAAIFDDTVTVSGNTSLSRELDVTGGVNFRDNVVISKQSYAQEDIKQAVSGDQVGGLNFVSPATVGWGFTPSVSINVTSFKVSSLQWIGSSTEKEIGMFRISDEKLMGPGIVTMNKNTSSGNYYVQEVDNFTLYAGVEYALAVVYANGDETDMQVYSFNSEIGNPYRREIEGQPLSNSLLFPNKKTFQSSNKLVLGNFDYDLKITKDLTVSGRGDFDGSLSCNQYSSKFTLPTTRGLAGQSLITNGLGLTSFSESQVKAQFNSTSDQITIDFPKSNDSLYDPDDGQGSMVYADIPGAAKTFTIAGTYSNEISNILNIKLHDNSGNDLFSWDITFPTLSADASVYKITINQSVSGVDNIFLCTFSTKGTTEASMTYIQRTTIIQGIFRHHLDARWAKNGNVLNQDLFTVVHDNSM
jgi:hypothetical protein